MWAEPPHQGESPLLVGLAEELKTAGAVRFLGFQQKEPKSTTWRHETPGGQPCNSEHSKARGLWARPELTPQ